MTRQLPRTARLGAVLVGAVLALSACRTSPGVAVYIGADTITTAEVERAVDRGLANPDVATRYDGQLGSYRDFVVEDLVATDIYDAAARRYAVSVTDAEIDARLAAIFATQDENQFYAAQAQQQGLTATNVREQVRRFLLGEKISAAAGLDTGLSEEALRQQYESVKSQSEQLELGFITVADQATADALLAQLVADPSSYATLAAEYAGNFTLPAVQTVAFSDVPQPLAAGVATLQAGQGFSLPIDVTGGIVVTFVPSITYPSFDDLRPTLEQNANDAARTQVTALLGTVQKDLDIKVNPRYGKLDDTGSLVPDDRGVVTVLEDKAATG